MQELFHADGVLFVDPTSLRARSSGLFKTVCDRFGPRTDTGMCRLAQQLADKNKAEGKPYRDIDPAILDPRVCVSFIGMGGSEWGTSCQADHQDAGHVALLEDHRQRVNPPGRKEPPW